MPAYIAIAALAWGCGEAAEVGTPLATTASDAGGLDSSGQPKTDTAGDGAGTADPKADAQGDAAAVPVDAADFEVASHTALPQLVFGGEAILRHPHVVTATFDGDPYREQIEAYNAKLLQLQWWAAVTAGYCDAQGQCIEDGDAAVAHLAGKPSLSYTDTTVPGKAATLQDFIEERLDASDLPAPVTDTVYVLYFPGTTKISLSSGGGLVSNSCTAFGGYHHSMLYQGKPIAYAVVPECGGAAGGGLPKLENFLFAGSHEIIEAVTDPYFVPVKGGELPGGYNLSTTDYNVIPWMLAYGGGETADLCPYIPGSGLGYAQEAGLIVTRSWSNLAAKGSHNPCVPAPPGPYFNLAPEKKGTHFKLAVDGEYTFVARAFSDQPMAAWHVQGADLNSLYGGPAALDITFGDDKVPDITVSNGDVVTVHVTRYAAKSPTGNPGVIGFLVSTGADGSSHAWPIWTYTKAECPYCP
ncbi:MAG: hypothetical protein HY902_04575 [Deltaproteobacteria bacterium]|nr:hypothetical protein [Deltaproteobacteria bacterium]